MGWGGELEDAEPAIGQGRGSRGYDGPGNWGVGGGEGGAEGAGARNLGGVCSVKGGY